MITIRNIIESIEAQAPLSIQERWDNSGLQLGHADAECSGALLCIDVNEEIISEAISLGFNLIISHHPLLFKGLKSITGKSCTERIVENAIKHGIAIYSAHTSMDSASNGVSQRMAAKLGLTDVQVLVPQSEANPVTGLGCIGNGPPTPATELLAVAKQAFGVQKLRYCGNTDVTVTRVAVAGGSCAEFCGNAAAAGAQLFLTADLKYHEMIIASESLIIADLGHFESEQFTKEIFLEIIQKKFPNFAVQNAKHDTNKIKYL